MKNIEETQSFLTFRSRVFVENFSLWEAIECRLVSVRPSGFNRFEEAGVMSRRKSITIFGALAFFSLYTKAPIQGVQQKIYG